MLIMRIVYVTKYGIINTIWFDGQIFRMVSEHLFKLWWSQKASPLRVEDRLINLRPESSDT